MRKMAAKRMFAFVLCLLMLAACVPYGAAQDAGACMGCGSANTILTEGTSNYVTEKIDEYTHRETYDRVQMRQCNNCGMRQILGTIETVNGGVTDHYYMNGTCFCGAVNSCTHPQEYIQTSQAMYSQHYEPLDAMSHNVKFQIANRTVCTAEHCNEELAFEETGTSVTAYTEQHMMLNGACTACGYTAGCSMHSYRDGVCIDCGQAASVCAHTGAQQTGGSQKNKTFESISATEHSYSFDVYWKYACPDCGETYQTYIERGTEVDVHSFMRNPNHTACSECGEPKGCTMHSYRDGVCIDCGQAASVCAHANAQQTGGSQKNKTFESVSDTEHSYSFDVYWKYACPDCGETYLTYIERGEEVDVHAFIRDPNLTECNECGKVKPCDTHSYTDGVCTVCGHVCEHEDSTKSEYGTWANAVYTYVNEEYHHAVYDYADCYDCNDCGKRYEVIVDTGREDDEEHEWAFNPNATSCRFCGAKKPCDTHSYTDGVCTVCGHVCEHEDSTKSDHGTWTNAVYTYVNQEYHHAVYDYADLYDCNDCGKRYEVIVDTGREDDEEHEWTFNPSATSCRFCGAQKGCAMHSYRDGVCIDCGQAASGCAHANAQQTGGSQKNKTFESVSDTEHSYSFDVYWKYACPDCGETYETYIERGTEVDVHAFIRDPNLTKCNECGKVKPCDTHSYTDGVCTVCGAVCEHKGTGNTNLGYEMVFGDPVAQNDAQFHIQPYQVITSYQCGVCADTFTKTSDMEGEEAHTFDANGLCVCGEAGQPTTCEHENTEDRYFDMNVVYGDKTLKTHTKTADVYFGMWCPDCETYRMRRLETPNVVTTEDHSYEGGVCTVCGHVSGCAHANAQQTGGSQKNKTFESISDTEHSYSFDVYWKYACPDCGETYETYIERGTEVDVHAFIRDPNLTKCNECGKVKPCDQHSYEDGVCTVCGHGYLDGLSVVLTLPADLTQIKAKAFAGNTMQAVIVPEGCTTIGERAFADCADLACVVLPEDCTQIAEDAFAGCEDVVLLVKNPSAGKVYAEENGLKWAEFR